MSHGGVINHESHSKANFPYVEKHKNTSVLL